MLVKTVILCAMMTHVSTMLPAVCVMKEFAMRQNYLSSVTVLKKIYMEFSVLTVSRHIEHYFSLITFGFGLLYSCYLIYLNIFEQEDATITMLFSEQIVYSQKNQ